MFIQEGDVISIGHYSMPFPIKTIVTHVSRESSDDIVSVKITKECARLNLLNDDPVVICVEKNEHIYFTNGYVLEVQPSKNILNISVNNEEFIVNHRAFERFPVSIYTNIHAVHLNNRFISIVKNISYGGLMICSNEDLTIGEELQVVLSLPDTELEAISKVIWKIPREKIHEYGLKIVIFDYASQKALQEFLLKLKEEQEKLVMTLRLD